MRTLSGEIYAETGQTLLRSYTRKIEKASKPANAIRKKQTPTTKPRKTPQG